MQGAGLRGEDGGRRRAAISAHPRAGSCVEAELCKWCSYRVLRRHR
jgi:hypothetical protein